ncbi:MAG: bifunctional enzyme CysN/CysC [Bradymonadia bacterium]|jgi:bifunctional enzyme CysN/CysC
MSHADRLDTDITTFLKRHEQKQLLRFVAVGSVDDGKSTLIGRLLHDTGGVYEDQLADARSGSPDGEIDFARITDGLQAEREQGITIDVAYRYFTTPNRKYIIADTPGHLQYTRNMATGASTAHVAIILIDARLGVLQQSRRHAYIASLLGIPNLLVAVNKMDLVDYGQDRYNEICAEFRAVTDGMTFRDVGFIPVSALKGANVVEPDGNTDWYDGPSVLGYLEAADVRSDRNMDVFRFPVQYVLRPDLDYRGFTGQVASGVVKPGDEVMVLPNGHRSRVKAIDVFDGELDEAFAPQSVTLRLEDEIDISRGDLLVHASEPPVSSRHVDAMVVWMSETPLDPDRSYLLKHTTRYVRTDVDAVQWRMDLESMEQGDADTLNLNDIGCVRFTTHKALHFDPYAENRATGAFIVIDPMTHNTLAAGMLLNRVSSDDVRDRAASAVSREARRERLRQRPFVLTIRGGDSDDRDRAASLLEKALFDAGYLPTVTREMDAVSALIGAGLIVITLSSPDSLDATRFVFDIGGHAEGADIACDGVDEASVERLFARLRHDNVLLAADPA